MKQNITPEQLDELSNKAKDKLNKWMQDHNYHSYKSVTTIATTGETITGYVITPLSIGQMIEFLENNTKYQFYIFRRTLDWKIIHEELQYGKTLNIKLCDALWEAVKEVLNNKEI